MVPEITPGPDVSAVRAIARQAASIWLELNLPNLITLGRLLSVPLAVWLIIEARYGVAFWIFVAAGISDALDGYIAKRFDRRTRLGALLDPIADKALLVGVYVTLGIAGQLPHWLVMARLPCLATRTPAPAATSAATVEMLKASLPLPPVPQVSSKGR